MLDIRMIAILLVILFIIVLLVMWYMNTSLSIKKEKRIANFALSTSKVQEKSFFENVEIIIKRLVSGLGKALNKSVVLKNYSSRYDKHISFEDRKEKNSIDYVAIKFLVGFGLVLLNLITIIFQFTNLNIMSLLITFLIGFFIPDIILAINFSRKRKQVEEDLLKAIVIMNNAFKSGRNIVQAVDIVKNELDGPISDEFAKIYMDMTYGLSLEVVFNRFYDRVQLEDAKYIVSSLTLLNRTGGNIVKVFSSIEKSFYNKKKLRNELKSLTASSIFVFRVLLILPFAFSLVVFMLNPVYFNPLFTTSLGWLILSLIIIIFALYIMVIRKVLRIDIK